VTEFVQGRTRRWGLAWSFHGFRPRRVSFARNGVDAGQDVCCSPAFALRDLIPRNPRYVISSGISGSFALAMIQKFLAEAGVEECTWSGNACVGMAVRNTWSRAARRRRGGQMYDTSTENPLGFRITVQDNSRGGSEVTVEWRVGLDKIMFESFCGKVKRTIQ